ncbi:auxin-responsive protein SAUR72-like [Gastrolobium bilobum]|uniref:auxin-responsive protein SAUR72-like n=1 Tax=Gastrolobium bilobum TaxID=150636 RepID=UPI002AAF5757|nr:auxin-responsive protein SAUR72-like [Gastrolobium bilobum]
MDSKKSNKIRDIVRLQQILKKWKKVANASKSNSASATTTATTTVVTTTSKGILFLKRTLSFTDVSSNDIVPKGFLAVCVGKELKRFIIPTDYLRHQAFEMLLREAEEEFGFQQVGVLKIPCQVSVFEEILKMVEDKKEELLSLHDSESDFSGEKDKITPTQHAQMCR